METGTCCWPAPPHICNYDAPGSHNRPWETKSFDLQILRGALHAEPKIKYWFTGFGSKGEEGKRWEVVVVGQPCLIVSTEFLWFAFCLAVRVR